MPGIPSGDGGNWANDRCLIETIFYRFKALVTLEQVNTTDWTKNNKNLN